MKRDALDWSREDVDFAIAQSHGFTVDQLLELDFPQPSYTGAAGEPYWTDSVVAAWMGAFHAALVAAGFAAHPEHKAQAIELMRDLIARRGGEGSQCDG